MHADGSRIPSMPCCAGDGMMLTVLSVVVCVALYAFLLCTPPRRDAPTVGGSPHTPRTITQNAADDEWETVEYV